MVRTMLAHVTPMTRLGVQLAVIFWSAWCFKQLEPILFPVVKNFTIENAFERNRGIAISGEMEKVRDCRFVEVVAYSSQHLVNVEFSKTSHVVSRVEGQQSWGWWTLTPAVNRIKLYALHECWSGHVTTKLFDGELSR